MKKILLAALMFATVSAHGQEATRKVHVSFFGNGSGSVSLVGDQTYSCDATCEYAFPAGSTVVLTAAGAAGSVFGGWGGHCLPDPPHPGDTPKPPDPKCTLLMGGGDRLAKVTFISIPVHPKK